MKHFSVTTLFLGMDAGQPKKKKKNEEGMKANYISKNLAFNKI